MDYMTFINENLTVVIIVAVVILMTIIGYFADKKYSGAEKPVKEKKQKPVKEENVEEVSNVVDDFDTPTDLEPDFTAMEDVPADELFNNIPEVEAEASVEPLPVEPVDNFDIPQEETVEEAQPEEVSSETEETPIEPEEIATTPSSMDEWNTMEETPSVEPSVSFDTADINEVTVPYGNLDDTEVDTENVDSEWNDDNKTPVEEDNIVDNNNITFDGVVDDDFKLPTIDTVNSELSDVNSDDDDVWKF